MKYFFIDTLGDLHDRQLCVLDRVPEGIGVKYSRMMKGRRIRDDYPENAVIRMSEHREGIKLASLIGNTNSFLMATRDVKEDIEAHCNVDVEYLPFTLINHKGRTHSTDYFIINPIGVRDCLDREASDIDYFGERVLGVNRFVLDPAKLEDAPALFRLQEDPTRYVVNGTLADIFREKEYTNILLREIEQREGHKN